jgi:hypothetical protein
MPDIKHTYQLVFEDINILTQLSIDALTEIGATKVSMQPGSSGQIKGIKAFIPSIWGWGGFPVQITVSHEMHGVSHLTVQGYIAQIWTAPLQKALDNFLQALQKKLVQKGFKSNFNSIDKVTPDITLKINTDDKVVLLYGGIVILLVSVLGELLGLGVEVFLTATSLFLTYRVMNIYLHHRY